MISEQEMKELIIYARELEDKEKILEYIEKKINDDRSIESIKQNNLNNKNYALMVREKQVYDMLEKLKTEEKTINSSEKFIEYRKKLNCSIQEIEELEKMLLVDKKPVDDSIQRIHVKRNNLYILQQKISKTEMKINIREKVLEEKTDEIEHLKDKLDFEKYRLDQDKIVYFNLKSI